MARERTPEGKRVVIPVRVSEPKADAIDKARGETPRSVWVEAAIDTELNRLGHDQPLIVGGVEIPVTVDDRQPPGVVGVVSRGRDSVSVSAFRLGDTPDTGQDRQCEHRIRAGAYCKTCGRMI